MARGIGCGVQLLFFSHQTHMFKMRVMLRIESSNSKTRETPEAFFSLLERSLTPATCVTSLLLLLTRMSWEIYKQRQGEKLPLSAIFEIARENTRCKKGLVTKLTKPLLCDSLHSTSKSNVQFNNLS